MNEYSRLLKLRKFMGMTQMQMAEILHIGQNAYSMIENGKVKFTDRNRNLLSQKLKINPIWLEVGIGEMFLDPSIKSINSERKTDHSDGVPYYDKPITGSIIISFNDIANDSPEYYINFRPLNDCSFYRPVYGESMTPLYRPGDIIACKQIINKSLILYGEAYLCMIKTEDDFYETIKILRRHQDPTQITLKPINPDFDETTIHIDSIIDMYIIRGKIERTV